MLSCFLITNVSVFTNFCVYQFLTFKTRKEINQKSSWLIVFWRYVVLLACCRCKYLTEGALRHNSRTNHQEQNHPPSQSSHQLCWLLSCPVQEFQVGIRVCAWEHEQPLWAYAGKFTCCSIFSHTVCFFIVYLKKCGTPYENACMDSARHGTSFQAPGSSDLIAKAQFLCFVLDRLNTFLFFCDTIIC